MASLQGSSTLPSTIAARPSQSLQPQPPQAQGNIIDDAQSIAMFTAVGHVGLHLVIRPLVRWGMRSFIFPSKAYIDTNSVDDDASSQLESESSIKSDLVEGRNGGKSSKSKRSKLLSNIKSGVAGPYSEIVCTFGTLAGLSYVSHPNNVLLYFGLSYPSMPFWLRFWHTLNDKKSKLTGARCARLAAKGFFVTAGFGVSMALLSGIIQNVPFFNIFCLAFWDCVADYTLSDGPDK